jgi:hypothetical protein
MAHALSLLVNDNPSQDVRMLDSFTSPHIFEHPAFTNFEILRDNSEEIIIDARYNLRPDLLSFERYGTNFWYPVILTANKLGSIFQFRAEYLNNKCLIPSNEIITQFLDEYSADLKRKGN